MADKTTILIVDDQKANRDVLHDQMIVLGHTPLLAENGLSALAQIEKDKPDLVLLDIMMPMMDGFQVLERLKADSSLRHIPVIVISAMDELDNVVRCIEMGAADYLTKPFNPTLLKARIAAGLESKQLHDKEAEYRRQIEDYNLNLEERVQEQVRQITSAQRATIFSMAKLAESRDPETGEHLERMREYCRILAERLSRGSKYAPVIDDAFIRNIYAAGPLHDIGKVGIPDRILQKPGKLTDEEFTAMKTHTTIGAETLRAVEQQHPGNELLRMGIEIAESHHEKWDGSGYPHGLAGEKIPLAGRILALGDVYDALMSKRCYKEAFSHVKSKGIILAGGEKHFDPDVVDAFLAAEEEFLSVRERFVDTEKEILT